MPSNQSSRATSPGTNALDEEVGFELLKILVEMAWADGHLALSEADVILNFADTLCPNTFKREEVLGWMDKSAPIPPPNLALLKTHRTDVMKAVGDVVIADGNIHDDEGELVRLLAQMLN